MRQEKASLRRTGGLVRVCEVVRAADQARVGRARELGAEEAGNER